MRRLYPWTKAVADVNQLPVLRRGAVLASGEYAGEVVAVPEAGLLSDFVKRSLIEVEQDAGFLKPKAHEIAKWGTPCALPKEPNERRRMHARRTGERRVVNLGRVSLLDRIHSLRDARVLKARGPLSQGQLRHRQGHEDLAQQRGPDARSVGRELINDLFTVLRLLARCPKLKHRACLPPEAWFDKKMQKELSNWISKARREVSVGWNQYQIARTYGNGLLCDRDLRTEFVVPVESPKGGAMIGRFPGDEFTQVAREKLNLMQSLRRTPTQGLDF